ncbi:MAG TPA: class D sortase [Acidobacteriaceae bacterium]|nr:class D sortase [Acidobacteriaceae bacterium]
MKVSLRVAEVCAWGAGLLCLAALLGIHVQATRAQAASVHLRPVPTGQGATPATGVGAANGASSQSAAQDLATFNGVIGRLEVPALGLHVPILNDYDPDSLRRGVGRMKGTAVPGGLGNLVLAGHRDTYFRPLRRVRAGMTMRVITGDGTYDYVVDSTTIVLPSDVDVLDIGDRPEMTLITCYPFDYIGAAPKRFIVRAHLVSVAGEPG